MEIYCANVEIIVIFQFSYYLIVSNSSTRFTLISLKPHIWSDRNIDILSSEKQYVVTYTSKESNTTHEKTKEMIANGNAKKDETQAPSHSKTKGFYSFLLGREEIYSFPV